MIWSHDIFKTIDFILFLLQILVYYLVFAIILFRSGGLLPTTRYTFLQGSRDTLRVNSKCQNIIVNRPLRSLIPIIFRHLEFARSVCVEEPDSRL